MLGTREPVTPIWQRKTPRVSSLEDPLIVLGNKQVLLLPYYLLGSSKEPKASEENGSFVE